MLEFFQGFIIGISLIVAIGPQNLFVINQGLKKKYILTVVLFCSISDSLLIVLGILFTGTILGTFLGISGAYAGLIFWLIFLMREELLDFWSQ